MENNLVELKYNRVNEYFERFKKKYTNNYEENKTKGYRTVIPYHMLIGPIIMSAISLIAVYITNTMMSNSYEVPISYTKIDYYNKIKSRMLNEIQTDLSISITEDMLISDSNGLIIAPNLSNNGNKKIFGKVERELKKLDK